MVFDLDNTSSLIIKVTNFRSHENVLFWYLDFQVNWHRIIYFNNGIKVKDYIKITLRLRSSEGKIISFDFLSAAGRWAFDCWVFSGYWNGSNRK